MNKRRYKDSLLISFGIMNIAIMTVLVLITSFFAIQSFIDVKEMQKVITNIAKEREVTFEKPRLRGESKRFVDGYHAAMMDKRNIKVFRKFFKSRRTPIIDAFFGGI